MSFCAGQSSFEPPDRHAVLHAPRASISNAPRKAGCSVLQNSNNCVSDSRTRTGWAAGGGIEYAAWDHVTLKVEYLHADFGTSSYINPSVQPAPGRTIVTRDVTLTNDIVRAGVNYKF
jgi:opacity protein-like surface antigen